MQIKLYKNDLTETARTLILFFNGWAMTPESVEHLMLPADTDLLVVWDYRDEQMPSFDFTAYKIIRLTAWSMGVWAANRFLSDPHNKALAEVVGCNGVAICGTSYPVHDCYGIPEAVFNGTLNALNDENRKKFNRRMCGGKSLKTLFEALEKRPTDEIRSELAAVSDYEQKRERPEDQSVCKYPWWKVALIGMSDRIIPPASQLAYWKSCDVQIKELQGVAHYPFLNRQHWDELWA